MKGGALRTALSIDRTDGAVWPNADHGRLM